MGKNPLNIETNVTTVQNGKFSVVPVVAFCVCCEYVHVVDPKFLGGRR